MIVILQLMKWVYCLLQYNQGLLRNDIVELNSGDYIELHTMNTDNDEALRVIDVNFIISQLG